VTVLQDALREAVAENLPSVLIDDADFMERAIHLSVLPAGKPILQLLASKNTAREHEAELAFSVQAVVPLSFTVNKDALLANLSAEGGFEVHLTIDVRVDQNWMVQTETDVTEVVWLRRPALRVGFLKLPAEAILSRVVDRSRERIADQIDLQASQTLDLRGAINSLIQRLNQPIPLPGGTAGGVFLNPLSLSVGDLTIEQSSISVKLALEVRPAVFVETAVPSSLGDFSKVLPNAATPATDYNTSVQAVVMLGYPMIESVLAKALIKPIERAGREILLTPKQVSEHAGRLHIKLVATGDLTGDISFLARPVVDRDTARIELMDTDVALQSSSRLLNFGARLIRKPIARRIEAEFAKGSAKGLLDAHLKIQEGLQRAPLPEGIFLEANLQEFEVEEVEVTAHALRVLADVQLQLRLRIEKLPPKPASSSQDRLA